MSDYYLGKSPKLLNNVCQSVFYYAFVEWFMIFAKNKI